MRRILSSIDLGSNSIKLVVAEIINNKLNVLCAISEQSRGIKKGLISNMSDAIYSIKIALKKAEDLLGIRIKKVVVSVPEYDLKFTKGEAVNTITNEDGIVTKSDVSRLLQSSVYNRIKDDYELINVIPIDYLIDDNKIKDPVGNPAKTIKVNSLIISAPKNNTYDVIKTIEKCNLEVVDIMLGSISDYALFKNEFINSTNGVIINLGAGKTNVSVFYKGILVANKVLENAGDNIDNDISFMYKIKKTDSKKVKEKYSLADKSLASPKIVTEVVNKLGEKIAINQFELCEITSSRLKDILKNTKNEINRLTKKEISYIIITGGLTEFKDFNILAESIFGKNITYGNVNIIGARDNKYSVSVGMIKNFNNRLNEKNKDYSILNDEELEMLTNSEKRINVASDSIIGKVFGYFFDN